MWGRRRVRRGCDVNERLEGEQYERSAGIVLLFPSISILLSSQVLEIACTESMSFALLL
jgi:hypothetical protein